MIRNTGNEGWGDDLGGRLRHAREGRGMSLEDAANLTKLPIDVLNAIERNDFESLPSGMYRKAYVRTLAAEVGLDPNEIASEYARRFEPADSVPWVMSDDDRFNQDAQSYLRDEPNRHDLAVERRSRPR